MRFSHKKHNISRMYIKEEVLIIRHVCIKRKSLQSIREKEHIICAPIRGEQNRIKMSDDWWENIRIFLLLLLLLVLSRLILISPHVSFQ